MEFAEINDKVVSHDTRLSTLEDWQKTQDGTLCRLEKKIERIYFWLIGLMGGMVVSLILLIADILLRSKK